MYPAVDKPDPDINKDDWMDRVFETYHQSNSQWLQPAIYDKIHNNFKLLRAQITHYYSEENLKGKQVIAVCNFPEKNIAGVASQILILGAIDSEGRVTLVHPSQKAENGLPIA